MRRGVSTPIARELVICSSVDRFTLTLELLLMLIEASEAHFDV